MTEHRYLNHAYSFDDSLVAELKEHRDTSVIAQEEKRAEREAARAGGLDAIVAGTPLDQVKAIIEKKKISPTRLLREYEVGEKMRAMRSAPRALDIALED